MGAFLIGVALAAAQRAPVLYMHSGISRVAGAPDGSVEKILRRHAWLIGTILEGARGEPVTTLVRTLVVKTASILLARSGSAGAIVGAALLAVTFALVVLELRNPVGWAVGYEKNAFRRLRLAASVARSSLLRIALIETPMGAGRCDVR